MILGERRTIDVYPAYTDPEWHNDKPCRGSQSLEPDQNPTTARQGALGGAPACIVDGHRGRTIWRLIQQTRPGMKGETGILYSVLLTTTRDDRQADLAALETVAQSFELIPIAPDEGKRERSNRQALVKTRASWPASNNGSRPR